jgi:hypothetical protein
VLTELTDPPPLPWRRPLDHPNVVLGRHRQDADLPVGLQEGFVHALGTGELVLVEGGQQLLRADTHPPHPRELHLPIDDQRDAMPLQRATQPRDPDAAVGEREVHAEQSAGGDQPAPERRVRTDHRVLDRVGDQQDQHEIRQRDLSELALPEQSQAREEREVHDGRADEDLPGRRAQREHRSIVPPPEFGFQHLRCFGL